MDDFFPVILGSDENAYGNARLFYEAYGIRPTVFCRKDRPEISIEKFDLATDKLIYNIYKKARNIRNRP